MAKAARADKRGKAKPKAKAKPKDKPARNGSLTALAVTVFALVAGAAGLVYWLSSSYDPVVDISLPAAKIEIAAPPEQSAEAKPDAHGGDGHGATGHTQEAPQASAHSESSHAGNGHSGGTGQADSHGADSTAADSHSTAMQAEDKQPPQHGAEAPAGHGSETAAADHAGPSRGEMAHDDSAPKHDEPQHGQDAHGGTQQGTAAHGDAGHAGGENTQVASLAPAPQPGLVTQTPSGPLPVIAPDGRTPLTAYARPYSDTGRPRIVIVLGNLGMSQSTTIAAIQQLPGAVTLAFHPYGRELQDYVNQARAAGHEVLLEVPMEPLDLANNDPGPFALLTALPARNNLERLDWVLGRFTGYVGVLSFMGSRFTTSEAHLRPVLEALQQRGLMFLDSQASSRSVAGRVADDIGLPRASNDRQIDTLASRNAIDAQLKELEQVARNRGQAVGIGFPYPVTIERLSQWARSLASRGIDLVPASALVLERSRT